MPVVSVPAFFITAPFGWVCAMFNRKSAMELRLLCIEWRNEYSIGHDNIDNEHKLLFINANNFITAVQHGLGADRAHLMLEAMTEYAKSHFSDEEHFMAETSYGGLSHHKTCHDSILCVIDALKEQVARGDDIAEELAFFIRSWLEEHVSKVDVEFRNYIRGGV